MTTTVEVRRTVRRWQRKPGTLRRDAPVLSPLFVVLQPLLLVLFWAGFVRDLVHPP